ncbi:hypothetical protein JW859_13550 [bacterium]|nr:hypothetical protein [bacterium]
MADFEVEGNEAEDKPKPRPKPRLKKAKGSGGNVGTIIAAVVAVAAIIMCVLLFMQMKNMQKQLGEAGIAVPAGLGGDQAMAAEGDGAGDEGHGNGEDPYDWQSDPKQGIIYELGDFTANTSDGKYAVMTLSLELTSGITAHDRQNYQVQTDFYNMQMENYTKALEEWRKKNKISRCPVPPLRRAEDAPLVAAGMLLLQHGAPVETGPPEMPHPPEEPRTILEQKLDENQPRIREMIVNEINSHSAAELTSPTGKVGFKTVVVDNINGMIDRHYGTVTDLIISDIITK